MRDLVTQLSSSASIASSTPGAPSAMPAPAPHYRPRGSSRRSPSGAASAAGSPPCSPAGIQARHSIADGGDYADPEGRTSRSADICIGLWRASAKASAPPLSVNKTPPSQPKNESGGKKIHPEPKNIFLGESGEKIQRKNIRRPHRHYCTAFSSPLAEIADLSKRNSNQEGSNLHTELLGEIGPSRSD